MAKKSIKIFAMFLLIFLAGCDKNFDAIGIDNGKDLIRIKVEIADDNSERAKGLMFRERLNENNGMLFIFDNEENQTFWMKNTLIPLDIIFIGENLNIVDMKYALPCKMEPCALYKSAQPSKYVLEVNSGFAAKNGIRTGDKIMLMEKY